MAGNPNAGASVGDRPAGPVRRRPGAAGGHGVRAPRPHGAPGHHAQAARRPGVPRVRHRRVQAGQVVAGQRPAQRAGLPRRRRHRHRPCPPPSASATRRRPPCCSTRAATCPTPTASRSARTSPSTRWPATSPRRPTCRRAAGAARSRCRCPASCSATASSSSTRPGVGGLGSAHSAATIGALPMADAVVFVSDASQEFTGPELEFLQTARRMCPNVVVRADQDRLLPGVAQDPRPRRRPPRSARASPAEILCVSSSLRIHALRANDRELNRESGFPAARQLPAEHDRRQRRAAQRAGGGQRRGGRGRHARDRSSSTERQALDDPDQAQQVVDNLTEAKAKAERLKSGVSKWQQTLSDGVGDLQADVDHDLRGRLRAGDPPGRRGARGQRPRRDLGRVRGVALPPGGRGRRPQLHVPARPGRTS